MKKAIIVAVIAFIALAACSASAQIITTKGIDRITLGSSREQVETVANNGRKILLDENKSAEISYKGSKLALIWVDGTVRMVSTESKSFATKEGAKVGSTLADLKRIYGKISMQGGEGGELYAIYGSKGAGQILFELGNDNVVYGIIIVKDWDDYVQYMLGEWGI